MKIIFFTDFYFPDLNGVSAAVELSAQGLRELGHRVYIVAPAASHPTPEDHPDVIRLPSTPGLWYKEMRDGILTPKYGNLIKNLKPDLYHIHTNSLTGIGAMRLMFSLNMPAVAHYHTDYEEYSKIYRGMWTGLLVASLFGPLAVGKQEDWPESLQGIRPQKSFKAWNDNMVKNLIRISYEYFGHIIVPSTKMEEKLRSYGVTSEIHVLPTGLDTHEFASEHKPKQSDNYQLLYIGRVSKEKNTDVLIDAMKVVKKTTKNVHLTIVGPGPYYLNKIRQKVVDAGLQDLITITGGLPRKQALEYYRNANVFLFPSMTDTQALVLNEAAYSSLPIIFSDPEISTIAQDKKTGLLVPPTGKDYADAILQLMKNPTEAQKFGREGHKLASKITILHQAKELEKIYTATIKSHTNYASIRT